MYQLELIVNTSNSNFSFPGFYAITTDGYILNTGKIFLNISGALIKVISTSDGQTGSNYIAKFYLENYIGGVLADGINFGYLTIEWYK